MATDTTTFNVYSNDFVATAKEYLEEYVKTLTPAAPHSGKHAYVCPCCDSGNGRNGHFTAGFNVFRGRDGELKFKCHACDTSGDIFDLAGLVHGTQEFKDQKQIVADFLNVDIHEKTPLDALKKRHATSVAPLVSPEEQERFKSKARKLIYACEKNVHKTDYFQTRGFLPSTIKHFHLGFDEYHNRAIIPFGKSYYAGRNIDIPADAKGDDKHYKPYGLIQPLFNTPALSNIEHKPVFVVEGPIDAMSIVQAGGQAIALGGHSTHLLEKYLSIYRPEVTLILALDSDFHGQQAQVKIKEILNELDLKYTEADHPCFTHYKDANEALVKDPDLLAEAVAYEVDKVRYLEYLGELGYADAPTVEDVSAVADEMPPWEPEKEEKGMIERFSENASRCIADHAVLDKQERQVEELSL